MQEIESLMLKKATELLDNGTVTKVIGWKKGDFYHDPSPATFTKDNLEGFVYNYFCGSNLSKYLINETKKLKEGRILVFLKPCDSYSFNQLVAEKKFSLEQVYVVGIECQGKLDYRKFEEKEIGGIRYVKSKGDDVEVGYGDGVLTLPKYENLLVKCQGCKSKKFAYADETIVLNEMVDYSDVRFYEVERIEAMSAEERYAYWQSQLSKCIRCNACRNVCPACSCVNCVFDTLTSGIASKSNDDSFEEKCYHIIRAYHVAGRCTDCGECSRVCPQQIPLHLLNRKFIKDINENYGDYIAGSDQEINHPLTNFTKTDVEAKEVVEGKK